LEGAAGKKGAHFDKFFLRIDHITLRVESRGLPIDINTLGPDKEREKQARRCGMCFEYKYENTWLEIERL